MPELVVVKDPTRLATIVNLIHDCWFETEAIRFDPGSATLTIEFAKPGRELTAPGRGLFRKVAVPYFRSFLRIHQVRSYKIDDSEQIGKYDFNDIQFAPTTKQLVITTGIPLVIAVEVEELEVAVEVTDSVVETKLERHLF